MHEIVTLQFGNQSNHIGTHFWNAQESYFTYSSDEESVVDHDINFRPGIGADGSETFTPRTVIYDVKDNFGALRQVNALYEIQHQDDPPAGVWRSDPIIRQYPTIPPHPYQVALDAGNLPSAISPSTVRFWSDYNRVFYHPRSMNQLILPTSHLPPSSGSQIEPLDQWDIGEELFKNEDQEHDLLDRDLRPFVEECDQMQGFQILAGTDDAWAGFAGRYIERMRDEYGRKSIWVWGAESDSVSMTREKRRQQATNLARSASLLAAQASLYIPLSNTPASTLPRYLEYSISNRWQTSALQATAFETTTLPTRLRNTSAQLRGLMADLESIFTNEIKRNVLQLSMSASKPTDEHRMVNGDSSHDHRMTNGLHSDHEDASTEPEKLDIDLFQRTLGAATQRPGAQRRNHVFSQLDVLRGYPSPDPHSPGRESSNEPIVQTYVSDLLSPSPSSFPNIFHFSTRDAQLNFAVKSALSASTAVAERLRFLADFVRSNVSVEEREELRADLLANAEEYIDGWEDEENSSDDDY